MLHKFRPILLKIRFAILIFFWLYGNAIAFPQTIELWVRYFDFFVLVNFRKRVYVFIKFTSSLVSCMNLSLFYWKLGLPFWLFLTLWKCDCVSKNFTSCLVSCINLNLFYWILITRELDRKGGFLSVANDASDRTLSTQLTKIRIPRNSMLLQN